MSKQFPVPNSVQRSDEVIVPWEDVPEKYQRKILEGTMTDEDWSADWDIKPKRGVEDVVSDLLNSPVARVNNVRHLHVFRKEYPQCMLRGCSATNPDAIQKMVGN